MLLAVGTREASAATGKVAVVAVELHAGRRARSSRKGWVAAEQCYTRAVLRAAKRDHMLADVVSYDVAMLGVGVSQDVLHEVVSELVSGDVDQWHTRAVRPALADSLKVTVEEVIATNLETLLNDFGSILIHAVLCCETENVVDGTAAVCRRAVFANVLDAPVAKLAMRDDIDACKNLIDAGPLVLLQTILEDVLDDKAARLSKSDFMPHAAESLIDILHDLRRRVGPSKLE